MHHEDVPRAQGRPGAFINQGRQEGRGQSSAVHVRQRALGDDAHGRLAALPRANLRRHRTSQGLYATTAVDIAHYLRTGANCIAFFGSRSVFMPFTFVVAFGLSRYFFSLPKLNGHARRRSASSSVGSLSL